MIDYEFLHSELDILWNALERMTFLHVVSITGLIIAGFSIYILIRQCDALHRNLEGLKQLLIDTEVLSKDNFIEEK